MIILQDHMLRSSLHYLRYFSFYILVSTPELLRLKAELRDSSAWKPRSMQTRCSFRRSRQCLSSYAGKTFKCLAIFCIISLFIKLSLREWRAVNRLKPFRRILFVQTCLIICREPRNKVFNIFGIGSYYRGGAFFTYAGKAFIN